MYSAIGNRQASVPITLSDFNWPRGGYAKSAGMTRPLVSPQLYRAHDGCGRCRGYRRWGVAGMTVFGTGAWDGPARVQLVPWREPFSAASCSSL
jgi:hypothetical protein